MKTKNDDIADTLNQILWQIHDLGLRVSELTTRMNALEVKTNRILVKQNQVVSDMSFSGD